MNPRPVFDFRDQIEEWREFLEFIIANEYRITKLSEKWQEISYAAMDMPDCCHEGCMRMNFPVRFEKVSEKRNSGLATYYCPCGKRYTCYY